MEVQKIKICCEFRSYSVFLRPIFCRLPLLISYGEWKAGNENGFYLSGFGLKGMKNVKGRNDDMAGFKTI
jgi:hypothetical protein